MTDQLATYSFDRVSCIISGVPITGLWEGDDCIKVTPAEDVVSTLTGADGNSLASISTNESAIVEIKLMPTSTSHALLRTLDLRFRKSLISNPFPVVITDFSSLTVSAATSSVILSKPNDTQYGKRATARTWRIFCARLTEASIGQVA